MNWIMLVIWVGANTASVQVLETYPDGGACNADKLRQALTFQLEGGHVMCMPKSAGHGSYINQVSGIFHD